MRTKDIVEGLQTLLEFYDDKDGYDCDAGHDAFYARWTDRPLSDEALSKMIELGWHQEHDERDYGKDFSAKDYRPEAGWVCYT